MDRTNSVENNKGLTQLTPEEKGRVEKALRILDVHYNAFYRAVGFAQETDHPVPSDTRAWSQILVSTITGIPGLKRKKGTDLADGSDVKGASTWEAIDTPRFNNCIPAGRRSEKAKRPLNVSALDDVPHIFFVLWDEMSPKRIPRCRIWCVQPSSDTVFREVCGKWYKQRAAGDIKSDNFQLHPPRNEDHNVIRNLCGNMEFPLLLCAVRDGERFRLLEYNPENLTSGECKLVD